MVAKSPTAKVAEFGTETRPVGVCDVGYISYFTDAGSLYPVSIAHLSAEWLTTTPELPLTTLAPEVFTTSKVSSEL